MPSAAFAPSALSWDALRAECADELGVERLSGTSFKKWLAETRGVDLSPENVRAIAGQLEETPAELRRVLDYTREALGTSI